MNLYEIDREIMACIDAETGEIIDFERLETLQMERGQKVENIALWIKNLKAEALALKAEKDAFAEREKAAKAKIESLSAYLTTALNGQKFSTSRVAVSFRSSEAVEITDESAIPREFIREKVETAPDKTAIKEALKSGVKIAGAQLVKNLNPQIK